MNHRAYLTRNTKRYISCWKHCQEHSFANQIIHDLQRWSATIAHREGLYELQNHRTFHSAKHGQIWFPPSKHQRAHSVFTAFSCTSSTGSMQVSACTTSPVAPPSSGCICMLKAFEVQGGLLKKISTPLIQIKLELYRVSYNSLGHRQQQYGWWLSRGVEPAILLHLLWKLKFFS